MEIVNVTVEGVGGNLFGQVKSGELVLKGYTYPRWDVRCLDPGGWRIYSSIILGFCPHSPWNRDRGNDTGSQDRAVLWDYWPRQKLSHFARTWIHITWWLIDLGILLLWQGLGAFNRERLRNDCGACNQYLCMHILSLVEKFPGKDGMHEVDLWALVLEPVPEQGGKYRRIGIARKAAYVTPCDFVDGTKYGTDGEVVPKVFDTWNCREVIVI